MCSVRPMVYDDISRMIELAHESYLSSRYSDLTFDEDGLKGLFQKSLVSDDIQVFVCVNTRGTVIGGLGAIVSKNPWFVERFASEMFFFVDKQHRGIQPALLLLRAYKNWACMRGATVLNVLADHSANDERTARLYQKAGFMPRGFSLQMRAN